MLWFADRKAALRKISKRNKTDELYEELGRAADALIEMQQAVDDGLDCIERIAGEVEEVDTLKPDQIEVKLYVGGQVKSYERTAA